MTDTPLTVSQLWRFPVKSMGGERLDELTIDARGVRGDRWWAVRDLERDAIASARRLPALLTLGARYVAPPAGPVRAGEVPDVVITLPDGREVRSREPGTDEALSEALGRPVRLEPVSDDPRVVRLPWRERLGQLRPGTVARDFAIGDGEALPDVSRLRLRSVATLARNATPPGAFVDLSPVHVLTEASVATVAAAAADVGVGAVDPRRFRANVLLAGGEGAFPESGWTGSRLRIGHVGLDVAMPTVRCVVPSRNHGEDVPTEPALTRVVARAAERYLGVYADVDRAGTVRVGDEVVVTPPAPPSRAQAVAADAATAAVRGVVRLAEAGRRVQAGRRARGDR